MIAAGEFQVEYPAKDDQVILYQMCPELINNTEALTCDDVSVCVCIENDNWELNRQAV